MTDLAGLMGTDPAPDTTEPAGIPGMPPPGDATTQGVHPLDQSVPIQDGQLVEPDRPPSTGPDQLGPQGRRVVAPWSVDNEDAFPVNQRAPHDWSGRVYTVNNVTGPIQIAGRLRGCQASIVWVPTNSPFGVQISPTEGDVQQGAAVILYPGDSIEIPSEGPVWCGPIAANASGGPVQIVRVFDPPGGGLGLSAS